MNLPEWSYVWQPCEYVRSIVRDQSYIAMDKIISIIDGFISLKFLINISSETTEVFSVHKYSEYEHKKELLQNLI